MSYSFCIKLYKIIKTRDITMNKKITLTSIALVATLAMTGCANTDALDQNIANLSQQVTNLSSKVDSLSTEVNELKTQQEKSNEAAEAAQVAAEQATVDAKNANERIDNVVASYKK